MDFSSLNEDELRQTVKGFAVRQLLPLREVNKKTRDIIDAELVHRHRIEFKGTGEKPIGHIIKDLILGVIDKKLQPVIPQELKQIREYGLSSWLDPDNVVVDPKKSFFRLVGDLITSDVLEALHRHKDTLLRLYPEHRDNIHTGFYKYLNFLSHEARWDEFGENEVEDFLATPEALANLAAPTQPTLLMHLLKIMEGHNTSYLWRNPVIQRIRDLRRVNEPVSVEYGVVPLLDADHRRSIRVAMRDTRLNPLDRDILLEYYENRCANQGLDPNGSWVLEHREFLETLANHAMNQLTERMILIDPRYGEYEDVEDMVEDIEYVYRRIWQIPGGTLEATNYPKTSLVVYGAFDSPQQELRHLFGMQEDSDGYYVATYP